MRLQEFKYNCQGIPLISQLIIQISKISLSKSIMKFEDVKYGSFCSHNYQKSLTNKIEMRCLSNQNLTHVLSQIGKICNKCTELLMKSLQTDQPCLICTDRIQTYLQQKQLCSHEDQQYDEVNIKCRNSEKKKSLQVHYVPLKTKVCKSCINKIRAAFNEAVTCKVCDGKQKQILEDIEKVVVSMNLSYIKNAVHYLQGQKAEQSAFKNEIQSFCKAEPRLQNKSMLPEQYKMSQDSALNHQSKRYNLYPKCHKHRRCPINVCNNCLVAILNLQACPYGCQEIKNVKKNIKLKDSKVFQTGFLSLYPHQFEDSYFLQIFVIRQTEQKGRLDRWQSSLRKTRPSPQNIAIKLFNYFALYNGAVFIGDSTYLTCGGVLGSSVSNMQPTDLAFVLRLSLDKRLFEMAQAKRMKNKRASHTVFFHEAVKRVYAIGGFIKGQGYLNSCQYYDTQANQWIIMGNLNIERSKATVFIHKNDLYVFGGLSANPSLGQVYGQKYNFTRNCWQGLSYQGFEYPFLTGSTSLSTISQFQDKESIILFGGSNYQSYSDLVQSMDINKKDSSFSMNSQGYLKMNYARCNSCVGLINTDIVIVFGGVCQHQGLMSVDAVKLRQIKDYIQPIFAYDEINLGSYKLMLRESSEAVYRKMYDNLQNSQVLNKQKLQKTQQKDPFLNTYNTHMFQKMFYSIGKTFVWVPFN